MVTSYKYVDRIYRLSIYGIHIYTCVVLLVKEGMCMSEYLWHSTELDIEYPQDTRLSEEIHASSERL